MITRKRILCGALLVFILAFAASWIAGSLLSAPANHAVGNPPADLKATSVQFQSESGSTIHGWVIDGQPGAGAVILMHGLHGDRGDMVDRARFLSRAGHSVLLFDFQARGESVGKHTTFGYLESKDAQAAVGFSRQRFPPEKIGVIGVSMGGAAAILSEPPLQADALILEMVYPDLAEAVGDRLAMRLGDWSRYLTPFFTWQLKPRLGVSASDLRPIDHVAAVKAPKLFIVGSDDQHTRLDESKRLFAAASGEKDLWIVAGARHQDLHSFARDEYERRVLAFFSASLVSSVTQ